MKDTHILLAYFQFAINLTESVVLSVMKIIISWSPKIISFYPVSNDDVNFI